MRRIQIDGLVVGVGPASPGERPGGGVGRRRSRRRRKRKLLAAVVVARSRTRTGRRTRGGKQPLEGVAVFPPLSLLGRHRGRDQLAEDRGAAGDEQRSGSRRRRRCRSCCFARGGAFAVAAAVPLFLPSPRSSSPLLLPLRHEPVPHERRRDVQRPLADEPGVEDLEDGQVCRARQPRGEEAGRRRRRPRPLGPGPRLDPQPPHVPLDDPHPPRGDPVGLHHRRGARCEGR